jgi:hypothetical protein
MALQVGPYFCQAASGTLIKGLTTRNHRGFPHLIIQAKTKKPRTEAQRAKAMLAGALSKSWNMNPTAHWIHKPKTYKLPGPSPYHVYMSWNFARIAKTTWPCMDFWGPPIMFSPNAGSCDPVVTARGFTCLPNCSSVSIYYWAAFTWSLTAGKVLTSKNATHWFEWSGVDTKRIYVGNLPHVAMYITYGFADRWGRNGLSYQFGPITPGP